MSRDVITVGLTMWIPLLYRDEYSQWREWFMNYLEEQTDGEAMINSIQNGDQPLPVIAQVSLARNAQNAPHTVKDLNNETAKDLSDALERQMRGSEYGEQDRKAAILYEYETFKAIEGEKLLDTYLRYLQVINDLKKCGYKKDNCELNYKFLNNLQLEWKQYEYYDNSTNYGLFVNNDDDQEIFHDAIESASENFIENQIDSQKDYDKSEVDHNDSEEKKHLVDKLIQNFNHKIAKCHKRIEKANQQSKDLENQNKDLQDKYDVLINQVNTFEEKNNEFNDQIKVLNEKNAVLLAQTEVLQDQLKIKHVVIDTHTECQAQYSKLEEERYEYMIRYSALCDNDKKHRKKIDEQEILFDKMSHQLVEMNNNVLKHQEKILEKETKISELEGCVEIRNPDFEKIDSPFQQTSSLKPYVPNVILKKIIIDLEEEVVSLLEKEKENLKTIESLKSKSFESSEIAIFKSENQSENDCHMLEKDCDNVENPKVIAPGMFKLSVSQSVSPISMSNTSCDSKNVENLDTFSIVRRRKLSNVIWKKKGSFNSSNVDFSSVILSKLDKNVKRYSRKDLLSCNNSHLGETSLPKMKFEKDHLSFACEQGKIHRKHHKSKTALASNKPLYLLYMDLCGSMRIESINGKRYVLVVVDDYSRYYLFNDYEDVGKLKAKGDIGVFVGYSKESARFRIYNKQTLKIHESVNVNFDEISEMASKQFSLEPEESFSSSLNDDVQQSLEEVGVSSSSTQSVPNNMVPNVDEASTSHNVFNERLEDAYNPSNVHTFYQPYPHEKKCTKDHPLDKIIGNPKSSVRTRGQLANLCLFSCLLSSIESANVAEALRDADWVSPMQEELDQFARLKV
uniref:Retroviral polymerase SH3-like domain-containing protein n=1 Tax=Tanacetum cinerariifolium TaxID=118510 RepID=A0A6L2LBH8_TANCI|nr:hypothetical protein [Tanacetum cinerariifolium]GEW85686.1 hypothetical protein [Tanacetum cinerariifolium]